MKTPISAQANIDFHAAEHPLELPDDFQNIEQYCLHLLHRKAYEEAAKAVPPGRVLDLGCNNGFGSYELSRHGHKVTGVDVSVGALADAERRFHAPNLEFRQVNGMELPFAADHFDMVTSFQVIEHIVDMDAYLKEIWRVLKPGGLAVFTTPNATIRLDPGMKPWNRFHIQEFTPLQLRELLRPIFAEIGIRGQFAADEIYQVEFERCRRALLSVRQQRLPHAKSPFRRVRDVFAAVAKRILPQPVIEVIRNRRNRRSSVPEAIHRADPHSLTASDRERLTTKDIFYRDAELERALDLMAICRKD